MKNREKEIKGVCECESEREKIKRAKEKYYLYLELELFTLGYMGRVRLG
jgi:hypothetical protein